MQRAIESAGIPTVSLSIFRGHSEQLKLPRVLLTRFERGSTVGPPRAPEVQRRVLLQALRLLETATASTLQEFIGD